MYGGEGVGDLGRTSGHLVTQQTMILQLRTSTKTAQIIFLAWPDLCQNPVPEESKCHNCTLVLIKEWNCFFEFCNDTQWGLLLCKKQIRRSRQLRSPTFLRANLIHDSVTKSPESKLPFIESSLPFLPSLNGKIAFANIGKKKVKRIRLLQPERLCWDPNLVYLHVWIPSQKMSNNLQSEKWEFKEKLNREKNKKSLGVVWVMCNNFGYWFSQKAARECHLTLSLKCNCQWERETRQPQQKTNKSWTFLFIFLFLNKNNQVTSFAVRQIITDNLKAH